MDKIFVSFSNFIVNEENFEYKKWSIVGLTLTAIVLNPILGGLVLFTDPATLLRMIYSCTMVFVVHFLDLLAAFYEHFWVTLELGVITFLQTVVMLWFFRDLPLTWILMIDIPLNLVMFAFTFDLYKRHQSVPVVIDRSKDVKVLISKSNRVSEVEDQELYRIDMNIGCDQSVTEVVDNLIDEVEKVEKPTQTCVTISDDSCPSERDSKESTL